MKNILLACALAIASMAGSQAADLKERAASQKDVQKLERELRRLRIEAAEAEKKAKSRSAAESWKVIEDHRSAIADAEKKLAQKLEDMQREADRANSARSRAEIVTWSVAGISAAGAVLLLLRTKRGRSKERLASPVQSVASQEPREILVDPDISALKEYSQRNNGIPRVPFILSLKEGHRLNCVAELRDDLDPLVYIERESAPAAWDKRRQRAAKYAEERSHSVNGRK